MVRKVGTSILLVVVLAVFFIHPWTARASNNAFKKGSDAYLSWANEATSYLLERSSNGVDYMEITETNELSYIDPGLSPGNYYYRVKAKNEAGVSAPSNVVSVTVLRPIAFTATWEGNNVKVDWNRGDQVIQGSKFQLWRMDSNTNKWFPLWDVSNIESFSYSDTRVLQGINYKYSIRSRGELGTWYEWQTVSESSWATGDRPLQSPGGLKIISTTDTTATVTWNQVIGASSYQVLTSTDGGLSWQELSTESNSVMVTKPCQVKVKAGNHVRSQWSGVLRVNN